MEDFYETRIDGVEGEIVGLFGVFDGNSLSLSTHTLTHTQTQTQTQTQTHPHLHAHKREKENFLCRTYIQLCTFVFVSLHALAWAC